ncbi:hypothetical protein DFP73DRAFT_598373 [Morchella snyderi]|nr:hypothetical protein DFP73DRAFT_598373 [Morchella snyderi]
MTSFHQISPSPPPPPKTTNIPQAHTMSPPESLSDPHAINTITDRIKVLKLSLSLSHRLHEGYLMQLARIRTTHAPSPAPAGDGGGGDIDPVYERVVLRNLAELEVIIAGKTQLPRNRVCVLKAAAPLVYLAVRGHACRRTVNDGGDDDDGMEDRYQDGFARLRVLETMICETGAFLLVLEARVERYYRENNWLWRLWCKG